MKNLVIYLFLFGLAISISAQQQSLKAEVTENLAEVNIKEKNISYLEDVYEDDLAQPVKDLEYKASVYIIKDQKFLNNNYETYNVVFKNQYGRVIATYDSNGKIIKTNEKFENVKLPVELCKSISKMYPDWYLSSDTYLVDYNCNKQVKKIYKVVLIKNNEQKIIVSNFTEKVI